MGARGKYALRKSAGVHCFCAPANAVLMKAVSLQRQAKLLAWQPVEPMALRAGLCWTQRDVSLA